MLFITTKKSSDHISHDERFFTYPYLGRIIYQRKKTRNLIINLMMMMMMIMDIMIMFKEI